MAQSTPARPQPPSISDPEAGDSPLWYAGQEEEVGGMQTDAAPPQQREEPAEDDEDEPDWSKLARDAFRDSTTYVDSNYRKQWDDSLRMFNGQHPSD